MLETEGDSFCVSTFLSSASISSCSSSNPRPVAERLLEHQHEPRLQLGGRLSASRRPRYRGSRRAPRAPRPRPGGRDGVRTDACQWSSRISRMKILRLDLRPGVEPGRRLVGRRNTARSAARASATFVLIPAEVLHGLAAAVGREPDRARGSCGMQHSSNGRPVEARVVPVTAGDIFLKKLASTRRG